MRTCEWLVFIGVFTIIIGFVLLICGIIFNPNDFPDWYKQKLRDELDKRIGL